VPTHHPLSCPDFRDALIVELFDTDSLYSRLPRLVGSHWGQGPMETSDYIVNTLKTLVQFTQPFTTRYILETFQMLPCHLSNMCLQNNISNVSRILPQMFPTYTQKSHADQSEKNWAHAEHIYNVPM